MTCIPIRFSLIAIFSAILLSGCVASGTHNPANSVSEIDIDEVDGNEAASEFARLCLARNNSIDQLVKFAKADGWADAPDDALQKAGLGDLRRKILEIPGGGGRYRETQSLLQFSSHAQNLLANLMERFDRNDNLVRTQCTLYAVGQKHLPICAAVGTLLKRPPDSNQRFRQSNAHFIRWNVTIGERAGSVRCDGVALAEQKNADTYSKSAPIAERYVGATISMIVDQATPVSVKRKVAGLQPQLDER